jgi:TRAP-type C4-dicarboxylate transport system permease small subunit
VHHTLKALRALARAFAWAGAAVAMAVGLTTVTSVVLRALTTRPIQGDVEITQFGIALAISLMLPWCQLRGANIIVDFFTQRLRERAGRTLDAIGCLLIAAMYLLLAWRTGVGARSVFEAGETSMIRSLPMWWVYVSLAPGLALAALVAFVQAGLHFTQHPLAALAGDAVNSASEPA